MSKKSRDVLQEWTTDTEVFQDMDNFELLNDSGTFALSIRLQFPKFSKGFSISDFEPFIDTYVGQDLVSIGRLSFPNEWQMELKSQDIREKLIRMGRTKINTRTCWISPLSQSEVRGFIHWIPSAVPNTKLEEILKAFGEILLMENQPQTKWKTKVKCDSRYFGLYLKSGKTMDDLPHFININEYHGLITIRGRSPSCFHCRQVGHKKSECKTYRDKISDYCLRPVGEGTPRLRPRGKRFRKHWAPKQVNQAVQTDTTCSECIKERSAAEAANASNPEGTGDAEHSADGAEGDKDSSGAKDDSIAELNDNMLSLTVEDTTMPGFWRKVRGEKKRLKLAKEDELLNKFREKVKAICQGPVQDFANLSLSLSAMVDIRRKVQESVASGKSGNVSQDHLKPTPEETVVEVVKDNVAQGPLAQLERLRKNIEEVLEMTRETLEHEFEAAKQIVLAHEAEKSSAGKKKRKRRDKKKKAAKEPTTG